MRKSNYGSRKWLESEYQKVGDDPWGLDWRPSQTARHHTMIEALDEGLAEHPMRPGHILDIGCATGGFTALLAERFAGAEVTGVDVAELAIARARRRYAGIRFERMTIEACPEYFRGSMDLVTMLEVLYYVPAQERPEILRHVAETLRPGGMLLVSSMIAEEPYMTAAQLRELVGARFTILCNRALYLKPISLMEKPMLYLQRALGRRGGDWGWHRAVVPQVRPSSAQEVGLMAQYIFGTWAKSHSYVIAIRDAKDPA